MIKYLAVLLLLTGCYKVATVEDVEKAQAFCKSHGLDVYSIKDRNGYIVRLQCGNDNGDRYPLDRTHY